MYFLCICVNDQNTKGPRNNLMTCTKVAHLSLSIVKRVEIDNGKMVTAPISQGYFHKNYINHCICADGALTNLVGS